MKIFKKSISLIILLIFVADNFAYAADSQRMLAPRILSRESYVQVLSKEVHSKLILSKDPAIWKPALAVYVQEFKSEAAELLRSIAQIAENNEKKELLFRAVDVALKQLVLPEYSGTRFTGFLQNINYTLGKKDIKGLDIGSGDGGFLRLVQAHPQAAKMRIIGIDNSASMIDNAFYLNMVNVIKMNACALDFADQSMGIIFLNYPNPAFGEQVLIKMLEEAFRVLENGGGIAFSSCENQNNGFSLEHITALLVKSGFNKENMEILKGKDIPNDYPLAGSALQVQDQSPYLILAKKEFTGNPIDEEFIVCKEIKSEFGKSMAAADQSI